MDRSLSVLLGTRDGDIALRRRSLLAFTKVEELSLSDFLYTHCQLWKPNVENARLWASVQVPFAVTECCERLDAVENLREIRDAHGRNRDSPAAKIGTLRSVALLAAVAESLAISKTLAEPPPEESSTAPVPLTTDQQRQIEELNNWWSKNYQTVEAIVRNRVKDSQRAADIPQEVYTVIRERIERGGEAIECLPNYVTTVARHKAISAAASPAREVLCLEEEAGVVDPLTEDKPEEQPLVPFEELTRLKEHVLQMPSKDCWLLVAYIWDKLKPQAIVQKLFYRDATVRDAEAISKRRSVLMKSLQDQLQDYL